VPPAEPHGGDGGGIPSRIPPGTAVLIAIAVFAAAVQEVRPDWLLLAARNSEGLADAQWWRVITALFAYDDGPVQKLGTVFGALALGLLAERRFGMVDWLIIAFLSGLAGSAIGVWWQPGGASPSPAIAGLLGATAAWLAGPAARREDAQSAALAIALTRIGVGDRAFTVLVRLAAALVAVLAVALLVIRDPHGPAIIVGAGLGALFLRRPAG
jgi:membrane associated rhomboid family serine protease